MAQLDPDYLLQSYMSKLVDRRRARYESGKSKSTWHAGQPLELLMAGYVGGRNTGADVRVEEMIRQFRHILGDDHLKLSILTLNLEKTHGYFDKVRQVVLPQIFPNFLYNETAKYHGVVACEGSMFKSKFADALALMMTGALGLANAEKKLSVGYGAEAGAMSQSLQKFVRKYCQDSYVICRNDASQGILSNYGIRTSSGTDTAWTFEPSALERGKQYLIQHGWDGKKPILAIAPINPYWWPVKPQIGKSLMRLVYRSYLKELHYKSIYFHDYNQSSRQKYETYLNSIQTAVKEFQQEQDVFPILVALEQLDTRACSDLAALMGQNVPIFSSQDWNMYDMVSLLRNVTYLVSSRYHAIVTSMPGLVASCGITMDERIHNLMHDRGHAHLLMTVDQPDLTHHLLRSLRTLTQDREKIQTEIAKNIPKQLLKMGQMGKDFIDEIHRTYPDFKAKINTPHVLDYLPPLPKQVDALMEIYG